MNFLSVEKKEMGGVEKGLLGNDDAICLQRSHAARCIPGNQLQGMQLECNPRAARIPPFCHHRYRGTSLRLSTMKVLLYGIITLKKQVFRNLSL